MRDVYLTGVGIDFRFLTTDMVVSRQVNHHPPVPIFQDFGDKPRLREDIAAALSREDRPILTPAAIRSLAAVSDALKMLTDREHLTEERKAAIAVYTAAETVWDFDEVLAAFWRTRHPDRDSDEMWGVLGEVSRYVSPLRLFKKLPTNSLYHVSKFFGFSGGGYPLRRMSLAGVSLVEEAYFRMKHGDMSTAVLCAYGDVTSRENIRLIQALTNTSEERTDVPIHVTSGAAALVLEAPDQDPMSGSPIGRVLVAATRFSTGLSPTRDDWLTLYAQHFSELRHENPVVVLYDNGNPLIGPPELAAAEAFFGNADVRRYKRGIGYSAAANTYADLLFALCDDSIGSDRVIIVNGVGVGMGIGAIALHASGAPLPGSTLQ